MNKFVFQQCELERYYAEKFGIEYKQLQKIASWSTIIFSWRIFLLVQFYLIIILGLLK